MNKTNLLVGLPLAPTSAKPNVLFFAIDDLRPELGCYRGKEFISSNVDQLTAQGTSFKTLLETLV